MYIDPILHYAREKSLSLRDAAQTFLQIIVLRHLTHPAVHFMGGTALVLGHGNPRFSEDVDLTQVAHPHHLQPGLAKARAELEGWFVKPVRLSPPKAHSRTWKLTVVLNKEETLRLHIDSQPYRAHTSHPLVLSYPSISPFVCQALDLNEILAEKIIAVAYRRYLGGRDLFDLWLHWLRLTDWADRLGTILTLAQEKLKERSLEKGEWKKLLSLRLGPTPSLTRARDEWQRYLPADFQKELVWDDIVRCCQRLPEAIV
jgi:predicted nucleotidyltransferase component of viral defense system